MKTFSIDIASAPDREKLVAEIWLDNDLIAEINQDNEFLELEIYNKGNEQLRLNFVDFINALESAKNKLSE
ncbi:hypothetical protein [Reichenbachiella sp.]|uniref:hypothetical protein n=1 Tax=Reichenbachiella sp. TaxID=2184521 RepID=UPI003BAFEDBB